MHPGASVDQPEHGPVPKPGRPWLLSLLVILIVLISTVATLAVWVSADIASPDNFVAVVAPVGRDPQVQTAIGTEVLAIVNQRLAPDPAASGTQRVAATLLRRQVEQAIQEVLASDRFTALWDAAVRETQGALRYLFERGDQSPLTITSGQISINLSPFVAEVRAFLEAQGIEVPGDRLPPEGDYRVVVIESDQLRDAQNVLSLTNLLAVVLPITALVLLIVACFVAANWRQAVIWTGVGLVVAMALILVATFVLQSAFHDTTGDDAAGVISDAVADAIVASFRVDLGIVTLAGILAIVIGLIASRLHRPGAITSL